MVEILYEDEEIIVVKKPVGMDSQSSSSFQPDMVSEIKRYLGNGYVGVIHRLDKPVSGVMVYAKTQKAAAFLSKQVQEHQMQKKYYAVVCGKPVDNVGNFVDYLLKEGKTNLSKIVDKGINGAKRAELKYKLLETVEDDQFGILSLVEILLITGRHHQIRVQFSGHGLPLWGDSRYNPSFNGKDSFNRGNDTGRASVALSACCLSFIHPVSKKAMEFQIKPEGEIFQKFGYIRKMNQDIMDTVQRKYKS